MSSIRSSPLRVTVTSTASRATKASTPRRRGSVGVGARASSTAVRRATVDALLQRRRPVGERGDAR